MAEANLKAAQHLREQSLYRSSVSRAYYAAFCYFTDALAPDYEATFRFDGNNPAHRQLMTLVRHNLMPKRLSDAMRRSMHRSFRDLFGLRVAADYGPGFVVDQLEAIRALQLLHGIRKDLEVVS